MNVDELNYLAGLGNYLSSEAHPGALPAHQNSPHPPPLGLYAEQINGRSFTTQRSDNLHSWLYRIQPSVCQTAFEPYSALKLAHPPFAPTTPPTAMRWNPLPHSEKKQDWLHSLNAWLGQGQIRDLTGAVLYLYQCNEDMADFFCNSDGELLLIPQQGTLLLRTELGCLTLIPGELGLIPRGIKFQVRLLSPNATGYVCENYHTPFKLPELGTLGANGLANPRDFQIPTAFFEDRAGSYSLIQKFQGLCWRAACAHSPLDVVAWHGNYVPYKYSFKHFNVINTVSYDHPDPSIFTVLTSPSTVPGTAHLDLVIFPPRWMVATNTFRPPYYHRNVMSEFMGLIHGSYDAKNSSFQPGGCSVHNCMTPHGPDAEVYQKAMTSPLQPEYQDTGLAFMLESARPWQVSETALHSPLKQVDYVACWQKLKRRFTG